MNSNEVMLSVPKTIQNARHDAGEIFRVGVNQTLCKQIKISGKKQVALSVINESGYFWLNIVNLPEFIGVN